MDIKYQIAFKIHPIYNEKDEAVLTELSKEYENIVVMVAFLEEQEHQVGVHLRKYALKGAYHRLTEIKIQVSHINVKKCYTSRTYLADPIAAIQTPALVYPRTEIKCTVDPIGFSIDNNIIVLCRFNQKGKTMNIVIRVNVQDIDENGYARCKQIAPVKGLKKFNLVDCSIALNKALNEFDWILNDEIKLTI